MNVSMMWPLRMGVICAMFSGPAIISRAETPPPAIATETFDQRLAAARSVKVVTSILGVSVGDSLERAHEKLDRLSDPRKRPKEEEDESEKGGEPERKILWQLGKSDYSAVFVKTDQKERIIYIEGLLRPGQEMAFDKIGEVKKAPLQDANSIVWDVVRPGRPLFRVVASGRDRKATSLKLFAVKHGAANVSQRD